MKKLSRILSLVMVLCMVFTMLPAAGAMAVVENEAVSGSVSADAAADTAESEGSIAGLNQAIRENFPAQASDLGTGSVAVGEVTATKIDALDVDLKTELSVLDNAAEPLEQAAYAEDEMVRVIVILKGQSLLSQGYTVQEISADVNSVSGAVNTMKLKQDKLIDQINGVVSSLDTDAAIPQVTAKYNYSVAVSGVAVEVPYGALEGIRKLSGVETAFVAPQYSLPEDVSSAATADPNMYATSEGFGSAQTWEELGYTGAGMRIAIIDTGLDSDHPSFAAAPAEPSLTKAEINRVLSSLSAYQLFSANGHVALTADDLYVSEKIPYAFNYVDRSLDETHDHDSMGDHGTHVAGIAAANATEGTDVVGVAPDAQLIIMKVFGLNGGAYFDDIMAAIEDCFRLNVDAVNMSLGTPAGFSDAESDAYVAEYFSMIEETDMIVSVAAGNSYSAAYGNLTGTGVNPASAPDNGVVSSPATYSGSTVVASVENVSYRTNYLMLGEQEIVYFDANSTFADLMAPDGATEYAYVMVPGVGTEDDFAQVDVTDRIAIVQRGTIDFVSKQKNAYEAGAVACIVYDNVYSSDPVYMQDSGKLPNVFISRASGEALAEAVGEDGTGTLTIMPSDAMTTVGSSIAGQMSDFSSWGVAPDLQLVPDVTAPGGNIYSCYMDGKYGMMSGTSMAAPHITGMSALVIGYLNDTYDLTEAQTHTIAEALIMSTAEPVTEPSGFLYSPRKQGAGSANVYKAVTSPAYLTVNGSSPKVSFGDDDRKTGDYTFTFELNNMSDKALSFALDSTVLTDQVDLSTGVALLGETSRELDAQVRYSYISDYDSLADFDVNGDGVFDRQDVQYVLDAANGVLDVQVPDFTGDGAVDTADAQYLLEMLENVPAGSAVNVITVPAGEDVIITVNIRLSGEDKAYMDEYYENGIYVDGFVRCFAMTEGAVDLSLPFLGFYGDWSAADLFDSTWYYEDSTPERYWHVLFTNFGDSAYNLGLNPYMFEEYDPAHNVLSPNGDGYQDYIDEIYLGLMRNARAIDFTWTDDEGNVLYKNRAEYVRKSYYISGYGICMPFVYSSYLTDIYGGYGNFQDGDVLTLSIDGYLDDGDMLADQSLTDTPIIIDTTAPELVDTQFVYDEETDSRVLRLTVKDNYDIAAVVPLTLAGDAYEYIAVNTKEAGDKGESAVIELDVSGYDASFVIAVCDYGCNESYYQISFKGASNIDFNKFYGFRRYCVIPYGGYLYATSAYNGWHSFAYPDEMLMHTSVYSYGETNVAAADYVDGYIVGIDTEGRIFGMQAGDWTRNVFAQLVNEDGEAYPVALDMAFSYTDGVMYILTDEYDAGEGGYLLALDCVTGAITEIGKVTGIRSEAAQGVTLACDNEGVLYTVDYGSGDLYTIDPETAAATFVGATGYDPESYQSMTVDHETDTLYWAAYQNYTGSSAFYQVDKTSGKLTEVTRYDEDGEALGIEYNSELTALFKPFKSAYSLYPETGLTGLKLSDTDLLMAVGGQRYLLCQSIPYYVELEEIVWTSGNENVATVENGVVTAVGEGETVITASSGGLSVSCTVRVSSIVADMYVYDAGESYQWLSLNAAEPDNASPMDGAKEPTGYSYFVAAAQVGGTVYAFDANGGFYALDAETMQGNLLGTNSDMNGMTGIIMAMAFNYADAYLYGIAQAGNFWDVSFQLVRINPANGETVVVGQFDTETYGQPMNLAIDPEGNFYSVVTDVDYDTYEYISKVLTFRVEEDASGEAAITGLNNDVMLQDFESYGGYSSLVYSQENDGLFWADYYGQLLWIDPESGEYIILGGVGETAMSYYVMNVCLVELPETEPEIHYAEPESISMPDSYLLLEGGSVSANVTVEPWNAKVELKYSIEEGDSDIAMVDPDTGIITGLKAGSTTLGVIAEKLDMILEADVKVVKSAGSLYGNVISDFGYGSNFWVDIPDTDPNAAEWIAYGDENYAVYSGAYYNGTLYAYGQSESLAEEYKCYFLKINPADYSVETVARVYETLRDMAFDYTTGTLYAIAEGGELRGALAQVDMETGAVAVIGDSGITLAAMTIDSKGSIYVIGEDCNLYRMDKATAELTLIGATGAGSADIFQSMHYDYNTGNVYWAQASSDYTSSLYLIDLKTGHGTSLGTVGSGAEVGALYTIPAEEPAVPATVEVTGVRLTERAAVVAGETETLTASVLPYSVAAVDQTLTWTSSDETVATVAGGVVTGVAEGTAVITATSANGKSATCVVTVLSEARRFYAYDETNAQWISFTDGTDVEVERADAEGESTIMASAYVDGKLYSYTADGCFWSVDTETFERTEIGAGVSETTIEATVYDWWFGGSYTVEVAITPYDLAFDAATGKTYGLFMAADYDYWVFVAVIGEVDLETGEMTIVYQSDEIQPGNLLVKNGRAYFVDTYYSGLLTYIDLNNTEAGTVQQSLVYNYWGDFTDGRSFIEDELTGTVYVLRDNRGSETSLWTLDLRDADVTPVSGVIGDGIVANSLFIK